jgi:3-dehydrosphinganine reductase
MSGGMIDYLPYIIAGAVAIIFIGVVYMITDSGPKGIIDLTNPLTHVIITGGSSGIGLSTAHQLRSLGCSVTIIARDIKKLDVAKKEIDAKNPGKHGSLDVASADVSNREQLEEVVKASCAKHGDRVDVLIASAGVSRPGRVEEVPTAMYESMVNINYLGSLYSALAVIPYMKRQGEGRLMFVSSLAALAPMIGFAGYSPSKMAVRGLAEVLQMELKPFNIYTSQINPPDVDTPMLADEMKYKPEECKILSEDGGLFSPEDIATDIIGAIRSWKFMVNTGFDGWLLGLISTGISTPSHSVARSLVEIFGSGILRFVCLAYLTSWNKVCANVHLKNKVATANQNSGSNPMVSVPAK